MFNNKLHYNRKFKTLWIVWKEQKNWVVKKSFKFFINEYGRLGSAIARPLVKTVLSFDWGANVSRILRLKREHSSSIFQENTFWCYTLFSFSQSKDFSFTFNLIFVFMICHFMILWFKIEYGKSVSFHWAEAGSLTIWLLNWRDPLFRIFHKPTQIDHLKYFWFLRILRLCAVNLLLNNLTTISNLNWTKILKFEQFFQ